MKDNEITLSYLREQSDQLAEEIKISVEKFRKNTNEFIVPEIIIKSEFHTSWAVQVFVTTKHFGGSKWTANE